MFYAYKLRSLSDPKRRYIGSISDLRARLAKHNAGAVPHTSKYLPWKVENYSAFETREKAIAFEMYLKSGSGRAFASKHFQTEGSACTRFMSNGYLERERFDTLACRS